MRSLRNCFGSLDSPRKSGEEKRLKKGEKGDPGEIGQEFLSQL